MQILGVKLEDLSHAKAIQILLKGAEIKCSPTDTPEIARTIGWLFNLGAEIGKAWQAQQRGDSRQVTQAQTAPAVPVTPPVDDGAVKVLAYHPGDMSGAQAG